MVGSLIFRYSFQSTWADPDSGYKPPPTPHPPPPVEKSQMAIGFLRNTSTEPLEKQLDTLGPITSRGRFVRPSFKYIDD